MQANDLIADLRAEVSAWWEGKMADHRSSVIAAAAAALVTIHLIPSILTTQDTHNLCCQRVARL